jgi:cytochrome P450
MSRETSVQEAERADPLQLSLADPEVMFHPSPYYRALRAQAPVRYDPRLEMYVVSRHEDVSEVLRNWEVFSLELGYHRLWGQGHLEELKAILERDGGGYIPDYIMSDPPRHGRLRKILENAFTPRRLKRLEPLVRELVAGQIEKFADLGRADGVADFAAPMTIGFMCSQLGLTDADPAKVLAWAHAYNAQFGGMQTRQDMLRNAALICELQRFVLDLVRRREAEPGEDMISDLVTARLDGEGKPTLTDNEVVALSRALLIGGIDTISTALAGLMLQIAADPAVAARLYDCAEDDLKLARFVEESIRLAAPVKALCRVATREAELAGTVVPADAQLLLLFASGCEDEAVFADPLRFDPERDNTGQHLAFGLGIHRCVGQSLARMQLRIAAREIARRLEDIRLAVPIEALHYTPAISMLELQALPLAFRRRTAP